MLLILSAFGVVVLLLVLAGLLLMPKKRGQPQLAAVGETQVIYRDAPEQVRLSLREQQLDEEAQAIAGLYRSKAHDKWLADLAASGSKLIAGTKADA